MGLRLVPKSVTLNDLEWRNGRVVGIISPNSLAFWTYYVKVVKDTPIHSASEMYPNEFNNIYHFTPIKVKRPPVASENLT